MRILAIESSCDETAAAVVEDGRRTLSSIVCSQADAHGVFGGVVPEIASRMHVEAICGVCEMALSKAEAKLNDIDAIAVTYAPGLIGSLLVGINFAKGLSLAAGKPLIPVHHIRGHIASAYLTYPELEPPFICLVASGGHSHIIEAAGYTRFNVIGRTRDDAAGEAFDKAARAMGLGYPGGACLDRAAQSGSVNAYKLPEPRLDTPYDFSFSGLKTAVINILHNAKQKGTAPVDINGLCASFQHTVSGILSARLIAAAREFGYSEVVAAGGVAANSGLRQKLKARCDENGFRLYIPPAELCGDNAAMIGAQAYYEYLAGSAAGMELNGCASMEV